MREHERLLEPSEHPVPPWRRWGPYVSERSWGTVREDYSADGNAWDFLPHDLYPHAEPVAGNSRRGPTEPEYELVDTAVFDEDRYCGVFVECAKSSPDDVCIRIEVFNRGPEAGVLHVLPHLWFRNTWSWG